MYCIFVLYMCLLHCSVSGSGYFHIELFPHWVALLQWVLNKCISVTIQVTNFMKSSQKFPKGIFNVFKTVHLSLSLFVGQMSHMYLWMLTISRIIYTQSLFIQVHLIHLTVDIGYGFFHSFNWMYFFSIICGHIFIHLRQRWMEVK